MTDPNKDSPPDTSRSVTSKKRPKASKPGNPKTPTVPKARRFELYADTFAKGIASASGIPCTPPQVRGPRDPLVLLMRTHGLDEQKKMLEGDAVLTWLEQVAHDYRAHADPRVYAFTGWTPKGLARWLDEGRPGKAGAVGRSHITVGSMPSGLD